MKASTRANPLAYAHATLNLQDCVCDVRNLSASASVYPAPRDVSHQGQLSLEICRHRPFSIQQGAQAGLLKPSSSGEHSA